MDFSSNNTEYYGDDKIPFSGPNGFYQDFIRFEWAQTWSGFILPIMTGLISAVSSALILFIIFKSTKKFKEVYHRILALISVLDMIFSLALAASTLPIPNEVFYSSFKGPRLGNHAATSCKIRLERWKQFFILAIAWGLIGPIISIRKDYINPAPYDPHCLLTPYPLLCIYTDVPCEHGDKDAVLLINFWSKYIIAMFAMIASGFSIVVIRVAYNERQMNKALEDLNTVRDVASSQDVESTAILLVKHTNSDKSYYQAFKTLLSRPEDVPEIMLSNLENVEIADRDFELNAEADEESPESGISYEKINDISTPSESIGLSAYDGISAEAPDSVGFSAYDGLSAQTSIAHDPSSDTPSKSVDGTMESISETGRIKNQNILYGYEQKHSFYDEEDIENFKRRNSNSSFDA